MKRSNRKIVSRACTALLGSLVFQATVQAATCVPQWSSSAKANTTSLQAAINQCSAAGGGLVDLHANNGIATAVITSVNLANNVVIKLAKGFTLQGSTGLSPNSAVLVGKKVSNVTITGTGAIDGDGSAYWASAVGQDNTERPKLIAISGSHINIGANFTDTGAPQSLVTFPSPSNDTTNALIIRNSPKEQLVIESGSSDVTIDGVWIYANPARNSSGDNLAPNTDAIDIIGTHVATIQNCVLDTGDDDIAIKSNAGGPPTANVAVTHCVVGGGHGISIGGQEAAGHTLADPGVSGVIVNNILFNGTDYGYRIKTDLTKKDSGATNDIDYSDTCMTHVGQPFLFTYAYASGKGGPAPIISNITIDNVIATATKSQGAIQGVSADEMGRPTTDNLGIRMTNTRITGGSKFKVTFGELQLGSSSVANTTVGESGQVILMKDNGPTIQCPEEIRIPAQI
ncbi:MAG TPA: glycosyl hydrolase family 28 protein [Luteibacter sp.]|jgi:polygalacturonase|uniref:glycoside hydrolase family 28 protein n=1 Tax=Luteibacter sp. TaxID=1886636 RepID=UPI002F3F8B24